MIELSGIARRLRLPVDQLRIAADLLEQGYQPSFIRRYRSDETGGLSVDNLWSLKLEIDRQLRLDEAKHRAQKQLPKDAELDDEARKSLEHTTTPAEIDVAMRCWRARRNLAQTAEREAKAQELLEFLISHSDGTSTDAIALIAAKEQCDNEQAATLLQQTQRWISLLLQCDTILNNKIRRQIQKKAKVKVEYIEGAEKQNAPDTAQQSESSEEVALSESSGDDTSSPSEAAAASTTESQQTQDSTTPVQDPVVAPEGDGSEPSAAADSSTDSSNTNDASTALTETAASEKPTEVQIESQEEVQDEGQAPGTPGTPSEEASSNEKAAEQSGDETKQESPVSVKKDSGKEHGKEKSGSKDPSKLTPRQRRRRWLATMLQPMKSLNKSVSSLTAYQLLMLGRGRRSQLIDLKLQYDSKDLLDQARDTFVNKSHPLANWFKSAVSEAFSETLQARIESDVLSNLEEQAQEKLLETAADQLHASLMRRPVRGHNILLIDTIGPKSSVIVVVDSRGEVVHTDEVTCSAQPDVVNQNVTKLGEIAHRYKVTLVAITNGPARRFLMITLRELMKISAESGLRWTMADRSGAEAYAAGKTALRELPVYNRRLRAAIWVARCLQNPLEELLKVDVNRMRLGSYQRSNFKHRTMVFMALHGLP
ncbi:MAG: Tex-like N-terminal domain-containing protein [Planctomycetota bacterium]